MTKCREVSTIDTNSMTKRRKEIMQAETGAASIRIELSNGGVKIWHGEDNVVLQDFPQVAEGTWSNMFDSIVRQLRGAEL